MPGSASRPPVLDTCAIAAIRDQLSADPATSAGARSPGTPTTADTFKRKNSWNDSYNSSRGYLGDTDTNPHISAASSPRWALGKIFPIIKDKVGFASVCDATKPRSGSSPEGDLVFLSLQEDVPYFPFCADFGPVSLGTVKRFLAKLYALLEDHAAHGRYVVLYTSENPQERTNAATLVSAYLVLECDMSPDDAWAPFVFQGCQPFVPFRDASFEAEHFKLAPIDVLKGLHKAKCNNLFQGVDLACYDHADRHETVDFHEIVRGKLVAFKGPKDLGNGFDFTADATPTDCIPIFKEMGVTAVVRLNDAKYDAAEFEAAGIRHYELVFSDCTTPTQEIMDTWFDICSKERGCIAVHCRAGIGRTGTLVCAFLQSEYGFSAREAIGYVRVMRPGSVLGLQQQFLEANERYFASVKASGGGAGLLSGEELVPVAVSMVEARRRSEENAAAVYSRKASRLASRMAHKKLREARRMRRTSDPGPTVEVR